MHSSAKMTLTDCSGNGQEWYVRQFHCFCKSNCFTTLACKMTRVIARTRAFVVLQRNISFSSAARAQAQGLLLRLNEAELQKLRQRLDIADADFADNKEAQVQAILSVVHRQGGPYRLLRLMADRHVCMFLSQHWEQIAEINNPEASGYDTDPIDYDMQTCQLFILWSWAHI